MFNEIFEFLNSAFSNIDILYRGFFTISDIIDSMKLPKTWKVFGHGSEKIVLVNEQYPNLLVKVGKDCILHEIEAYKELSEKLPNHVAKYYMFGKMKFFNFAICEKLEGSKVIYYDWAVEERVENLLNNAKIKSHFEYAHAPNLLLGNDGHLKFVDLS